MKGIIGTLQKRLDELQEDCRLAARGARCLEQPCWFLSRKDGESEKPGVFDFDGIHELFDRTEAEESYVTAASAASGAGTRQDMALASNQSDILSAMERAYLLRHRTRTRMLAHEANARRHVGSDVGVLKLGIQLYIENQAQRVQNNGND